MNIAILGTGMVGRAIAGKLAEGRDTVAIGTRDPQALKGHPGSDRVPPFTEWQSAHPAVTVATFFDAAAAGEIIVNATPGSVSIDVLRMAGPDNLDGKVLVDVSNPLDFSSGMPPTLFTASDDSLGERIQREFPAARVVKTLNTVNAAVMVAPRRLADGDNHAFVSGNDPEGKRVVTELLQNRFGWRHVIDLGDITTARGAEMLMPMWLRLMATFGTAEFAWKVVT